MRSPMVWISAVLLTATAEAQLPPPPVPPENPITAEKVVLGKILFFDEQLSSDNTVACGTCHRAGFGGAAEHVVRTSGVDRKLGTLDDIFASRGITAADASDHYEPDAERGFAERATERWAQTSLVTQYFRELFWDGRAPERFIDPETGAVLIPLGGALESQSVLPPLGDHEMAHANRDWSQITAKLAQSQPLALATDLPADVASAIAAHPSYPDLFEWAFGDPALGAARIAFALATFERTLVPDDTPFDLGTLTDHQRRGFDLFNTRARCTVCHPGPIFADDRYHNIGLRPALEDLGRTKVTGDYRDRGKFKTPSLRNAGLRPRYFHNGQFRDLHSVIEFYNRGGDFSDNLDLAIQPLGLKPVEIDALLDFVANGITSPSVAAEQFPYDRPTLWSERRAQGDQLEIYGTGGEGSGHFVPNLLARSPANLGNVEFKLGVYETLGGAPILLIASPARTPPGTEYRGIPIHVDFHHALFLFLGPASGIGEGEGYRTFRSRLPTDPALRGIDAFAQWFVFDPSAAPGFATSAGVRLRFF